MIEEGEICLLLHVVIFVRLLLCLAPGIVLSGGRLTQTHTHMSVRLCAEL